MLTEMSKASSTQREPRRARMANAASQITSLQFRRPLPQNASLARSFPSGRTTRQGEEAPKDAADSSAPKIITPRRPLTPRRAAPPGTMVRAPSKIRMTRNPSASKLGGPNLRGRSGSNRGGTEAAPRRRERKQGGTKAPSAPQTQDVPIEHTISDGLAQHLLRLQRKEWDRVPYKPRYAPGSFEANELMHLGAELFRGEAPPVKVWGRMEKALGVVGMHGAEAHLEVRRVRPRLKKHRFSQKRIEALKGAGRAVEASPIVQASPAAKSQKVVEA